MNRLRFALGPLAVALMFFSTSAHAEAAPFIGANLGVAEPTNDNFRAHVQTGGSGSPFVGYMFNDYFGVEGDLQFSFNDPDAEAKITHQTTTVLGYTIGPRINIPLGDVVTLYGVGQGGGFTGLSGALNRTAPGFSVGGGVDFNMTRNLSVGLFGRWNRAYMAPRLSDNTFFLARHVHNDQGPKDARWGVYGVGLKYTFAEAAAAPPPPPPPPPVAQAPPPPPPVKKKIVLRSVHFDFDKATIRADARPVLDEAVQTLKEENAVAVIVEGHTDSVGSDAYNMKLSKRRANAVRDYLVSHGIPDSRIRTEGFGETRPVASNDTADGRAQNRRVELHVE